MRLPLKGALRLVSVENLSTGIEASASGESLNSGDPAVHPAARHIPKFLLYFIPIQISDTGLVNVLDVFCDR